MVRALDGYIRASARSIRHFLAARQAATAVEFAMIAPAFLALLIAIFEISLFLFAQQSLQNAAMQVGRLFMTGQAQSYSQTNFNNLVCQNYLPSMFSCSKLAVVVQEYSSFAAASTSAPVLYQNGQWVTTFAYNPGTPGQIMVVQLAYPWAAVGGPLGFLLSNLPNGAAEIMGVTAFRVEPY
jgi:Flp pilus assembly protein TadG